MSVDNCATWRKYEFDCRITSICNGERAFWATDERCKLLRMELDTRDWNVFAKLEEHLGRAYSICEVSGHVIVVGNSRSDDTKPSSVAVGETRDVVSIPVPSGSQLMKVTRGGRDGAWAVNGALYFLDALRWEHKWP